ncbi:hypothetical protein [Kineococcus sp. SYSU DK002]|uniref:hypothetical protein n=1 Tax=Kineococcus sp. SYSU DK002 TaxID=3383123 RepID=UPI003D7E2FBD
MSTVTTSILVGNPHRYRGGVRPGWLVLLHEGAETAWQLLRLDLFEGEERSGLDGAPGITWHTSSHADLIGELALLLHLHVVQDEHVIAAAAGLPRLTTQRRVGLTDLTQRERGVVDRAVQTARRAPGDRCLSVTVLPGSALDASALLELPAWEVDLAAPARSRRIDSFSGAMSTQRTVPDVRDDVEVMLSGLVTSTVLPGINEQHGSWFFESAAEDHFERSADVLCRWIAASLAALEDSGAFSDSTVGGLAEVLDDLTPNQARLLAGMLEDGARAGGSTLQGSGDSVSDLQDLFALACRVAGQAVAHCSSARRIAPWLVLDGLNPSAPTGPRWPATYE